MAGLALAPAAPRAAAHKRAQGLSSSRSIRGRAPLQLARRPAVPRAATPFEGRGRWRATAPVCFLPPAFISAAVRTLTVRGPGQLLVKGGTSAGGGSLPWLSLILLAYGVAVTLYAARKDNPGRGPQEAQAEAAEQLEAPSAASFDRPPAPAAPARGAARAAAARGMQICMVCGGRGAIDWEGKFAYEDHTCPRCLGKGYVKPATGKRVILPGVSTDL